MNVKRIFVIAAVAMLLFGLGVTQAAPNLPNSTSQYRPATTAPDGGPIGCRAGLAQPNSYQDLFFDNMENGTQNWLVGGQNSTWQLASDSSHSPTHAWFAADPDAFSLQYLGLAITISVPITAPAAGLAFWQRYNFGQGNTDGGVLEYRTDPGMPWQDAGPLFLQNGYTGVITGSGNPLSGRSGFVGTSNLYPEYIESILDLGPLRDHQVSFRFVLGSDSTGSAPGWRMDDFEAYVCTAPSTPTETPTETSTPEPSTATPPLTATITATPINTATLTPQPTATLCTMPFTDVNGNIFYEAIKYLYCRNVISGISPTLYGPSGTSTRAQFAKVVVLGFNIAIVTPTSPHFSDVPANYFAYPYIEGGYAAGILNGYDQATCEQGGAQFPCYFPNRPITRGQLTKLVVGAAHYPPFTPSGAPTFRDVLPNNVFFAAIETAHNKGVINGYPDNTFRPNNNIRRDEMAQVVYKAITSP